MGNNYLLKLISVVIFIALLSQVAIATSPTQTNVESTKYIKEKTIEAKSLYVPLKSAWGSKISGKTTKTTFLTQKTPPSTVSSYYLSGSSTSSSSSSSNSGVCDCSYNRYNCGDFTSSDAQDCYLYCKSLGKGDIHDLDRDHDGDACEYESWSSPSYSSSSSSSSSSTTSFISPSSSSSSLTSSSGGSCPTGKCWVNSYTRKDGTHVNGYCRKC
jgi:hypothetical protein